MFPKDVDCAIGRFSTGDVPAALDALLEHPEVVADAVAGRRELERGERVHET
jgi:hypothetical protein